MTLDDAIAHAREIAAGCGECAEEHAQLAEWLEELRGRRGESDEGCYLMRDGKKFPVELDYGFLGIMPISINVAGFRYLLEVPDGE